MVDHLIGARTRRVVRPHRIRLPDTLELPPSPIGFLVIIAQALMLSVLVKIVLPKHSECGGANSFTSANITVADFYPGVSEQYPLTLRHINAPAPSPDKFSIWVSEEASASLRYMLRNIHTSFGNNKNDDSGSPFAPGTPYGVVIASPSTVSPDYYYQWARDGAIVINSLLCAPSVTSGTVSNKDLTQIMLQYLNNSVTLQRLDNRSGKFSSDDGYRGVAEPKYNVDGTVFNGNWGRPQNDGPALRAAAALNFISRGVELTDMHSYVFCNTTEILETLVYYDLKFIVENYSNECFDLWEEYSARHFFTAQMQLYALQLAIPVWRAQRFPPNNDTDLLQKMITTRDALLEFVLGPQTPCKGRSGLDIATVLASILSHPHDSNVSMPFDIDDTRILGTLHGLIAEMKEIYPLNNQHVNGGVAIGRYPEDIYDGVGTSEGNPWFISTIAAGNLMYKLVEKYMTSKNDIVIQTSNSPFWGLVIGGCLEQFDEVRLPYNSLSYNATIANLFNYGDSFLEVVRIHMDGKGSMSEQFNKYSGYMVGARDLTWSYSTFIETAETRNRIEKNVSLIQAQ